MTTRIPSAIAQWHESPGSGAATALERLVASKTVDGYWVLTPTPPVGAVRGAFVPQPDGTLLLLTNKSGRYITRRADGNLLFYGHEPGTLLVRYSAGDLASLSNLTVARATTATYRDVAGYVRTSPANTLRDGHYVGAVRTTLLEEARTNLLLDGHEIGPQWELGNITTSTDGTLGPDGITLARKLTTAGGPGSTMTQAVTSPATGPFTYSVFVKKGSNTGHGVRYGAYNIATGLDMYFISIDHDTATFTEDAATAANGSTRIVQLANGWLRVELTINEWTAGQSAAWYIGWSGSPSTGESVYAWGAELEAGVLATSLIPTVATPVTRAADVVTLAAVPAAAGGTTYMHYVNLATHLTVESVAPYDGAALVLPAGRAYRTLAIAKGTRTLTEMQALLA